LFKNINKILYILGKDKIKLPFIVLLFMGISLLDLIGLGLIGPYIALVTSPDVVPEWITNAMNFVKLDVLRNELLIYIGIAITIVFLTKTIVIILVNFIITDFTHSLQLRLRCFLMESYQAMKFEDYLSRNSSEYIHNIQNITSQFSQNVVLTGLRVVGDVIIAIAILSLLAIVNITALLVLSSILILTLLIYDLIFRKRLVKYGLESNRASMSMVQGINEGMDGFKEVRILGKTKYFYNKVKAGAYLSGLYQRRLQLISLAPRYVIEFLLVSFIVAMVSIFISLNYDVSSMMAILSVYGVASMRLMPIATSINASRIQFQFSKDSISRLYEDIYRFNSNKINLIDDFQCKKLTFESLKVENVNFSYKKTNQLTLKNISLTINKGEVIGFIGESGSGKTTLLDLMLGLLSPNSGEVTINGQSMQSVLPCWRENIAYLPQQIFLIDDTLAKNIALGCDENEINKKQLMLAIKNAQLSEMVNNLEKGVKTAIGERGVRLSGGQRQRVALARSFYHKRDVLVMDESTSALDLTTEREVVKEIERLKGDKTIIIIAHRLQTLKNCDRIYKLSKGSIVDVGSPENWINDK
jgi:ATP-binding cassette, subfamily B, bacterial PglK